MRINSEIWIMNAYLKNNKNKEIQPVYYYYIDSFLENNIQVNRIWWEIIWENDPYFGCYFYIYKI